MEYILVFGVAKVYRMEGCGRKSHKGWVDKQLVEEFQGIKI